MTQPKSQRRTLWLLIAVFFLPLAVAFYLYFGTSWRPPDTSNNGVLLSPTVALPQAAAPLRGKWLMVYIGEGACDEDCRRALVFARQTRLSLNQEMERVDRVFLATGSCCDLPYLKSEHLGLKVFDVSDEFEREELVSLLPPGDWAHSLYIVDPLGNVIMRYDVRQSPRGLLDDLKKLLKLSHIG